MKKPFDPAAARRRAHRSRDWAAAMAGVSEPTAKLYELDPKSGVKDERKRAALDAVYRAFTGTEHHDSVPPSAAAKRYPSRA